MVAVVPTLMGALLLPHWQNLVEVFVVGHSETVSIGVLPPRVVTVSLLVLVYHVVTWSIAF